MNLIERIKKFTFNSYVMEATKCFGFRNFMRNVYYLLTRPKIQKRKISFDGIEAFFRVSSADELRLVEIPFEDGMGNEKFVLGKLLQSLYLGDVVFDIGASIGIHTVFMAKKVDRSGLVIAIEPEDHSYTSLQANLKLNNLNNVFPYQVALGNYFGKGKLYRFRLLKENTREVFNQGINVIPGDVLIRNKRLPNPHVLKMDVEGYEYYVIQGLAETLKQDKCRLLCCEVHPMMLPEGITVGNIENLLKSFGFCRTETLPRGDTFHIFFYKW
jgi:FkbM family methyltransferase